MEGIPPHAHARVPVRTAAAAAGMALGMLATVAVVAGAAPRALAGVAATAGQYSLTPVDTTRDAPPLVMLTVSKEHFLWSKAYDDYSDLDGDGIAETGYEHERDYIGYFDSRKCYDYDPGLAAGDQSGGFIARAHSADKYCDGVSGSWSGNFLNWATMTKMDIIRKVLYGGRRVVDTAGSTVLERAHIPSDVHSFAKHYAGADLPRLTPYSANASASKADRGITLCNTTVPRDGELSQQTEEPPLFRVARGDYSLWAAGETVQCRWREEFNSRNGNIPGITGMDAHPRNPQRDVDGLPGPHQSPDYAVRVAVCREGVVEEFCDTYPDDTRKPVGLLHTFGEKGRLKFGLITDTHARNLGPGVLRKNIGTFDDEVNTETDGTFTGIDGIVTTLDALRIADYVNRGLAGGYFVEGGYTLCRSESGPTEGRCRSWGNPLAETYREAVRYFAGESATASSSASAGMPAAGIEAKWNNGDLLDGVNACSPLTIVSMNSGIATFDADELGADGRQLAATLTDHVGAREGINGSSRLVPGNGGGPDAQCTESAVPSLADVRGMCPEIPRQKGSYLVSGLALDAHGRDVRSDVRGSQSVTTFGVALSTSAPRIEVKVPGPNGDDRSVVILPACENLDTSGCQIADFRVIEQDDRSGTYYVNWDDREAGSDADQDMWGTVSYRFLGNDRIEVRTLLAGSSATNRLGFGYVISGTTRDGFHVHNGINDFEYQDPLNDDSGKKTSQTGIPDCHDPACDDIPGGFGSVPPGRQPARMVYDLANGSSNILERPLYYAAKYGGFERPEDEDYDTGESGPLPREQWDRINNLTGAAGADGVPDTYFYIQNPAELVVALSRSFTTIAAANTGSGSAAAVVASRSTGTGAVYQAYYRPEFEDAQGNTVTWTGHLQALWIDEYGLLREDTNGDGVLGDYKTDNVIEYRYDEDLMASRAFVVESSRADRYEPSVRTETSLENLNPIWDAGRELGKLSDTKTREQRPYGTGAGQGRHILTWLDHDEDGHVDDGEVVPFDEGSFDRNTVYHLGVNTETEADEIVRYIRGDDSVEGFRRRRVDIDGDGEVETWRLGDIIHSSPAVVGPPARYYDQLFGDESYALYRDLYKDRRNVIYAGGNDGLLHAFNGGAFDADDEGRPRYTGRGHPLGAELWAYAPKNLLPHLRWLTQPDYPHVYYVDGAPVAFDVKMFPEDANRHPGGWGTLLVVPMRLGGGEIEVSGPAGNQPRRSAYILFDVTDPEDPPRLLAEITDPALGYTTSRPDVALRIPSSGGAHKPYLVFGSGPTDAANFTSQQEPTLFELDLAALAAAQPEMKLHAHGIPFDAGNGNDGDAVSGAFIGDIEAVDFDIWSYDKDYSTFQSDAYYFGLVIDDDPVNPDGELGRYVTGDNIGKGEYKPLLRSNQPILTRPLVAVDDERKIWVYAGTGRYQTFADKESRSPQAFYGIIEKGKRDSLTFVDRTPGDDEESGGLVDVTDFRVHLDTGEVSMKDGGDVDPVNGKQIDNFDDLEKAVSEGSGWMHRFPVPAGEGGSARSLAEPDLLDGVLAFTEYTPNPDLCETLGTGALHVVWYKTGTGHPDGFLDPGAGDQQGGETGIAITRVELQGGRLNNVVIYPHGTGGMSTGSAIGAPETGGTDRIGIALPGVTGRRATWREIEQQ